MKITIRNNSYLSIQQKLKPPENTKFERVYGAQGTMLGVNVGTNLTTHLFNFQEYKLRKTSGIQVQRSDFSSIACNTNKTVEAIQMSINTENG